jgi:hypothetical protein
MTIKFANNISTTLALGAGIAATSFDVASTTGFPTLGVGDYFYGTLSNTLGAIEIVQVTSWTGTTVTCTRGAEGTPSAAWSTGDSFEIRITAAGLTTVLNATEVVEEVQTATSGQTVFTLTTFMYVPGENTLSVYVDGVNQIVDLSYAETGTTTVTFISGLHLGALVKFTTLRTSGLTTSAAVVTYEPAGTGAVATTVQDKLRESVSVLDFGGDIQLALNAVNAAGGGTVFVPEGTYTITDPLTMYTKTRLIGDGKGSTVIRKTTGNTVTTTLIDNLVCLDLTPIGAACNCILYVYDAVRAVECEIAGITFTTSGTNATGSPVKYGIVAVGMSESSIHDVTVSYVSSASFVTPVIFLSTITNFTSFQFGQGLSTEVGTSLTITSNYSSRCQKYGYFLRDVKYSIFTANACDSLNEVALCPDYTDRTVNSIAYMFSACYSMDITANGAEQCFGTQFKLDSCIATTVKNNVMIGPASSYTGAGQVAIFYIATTANGVCIEDNFVWNSATPLQGGAVAGQHHDVYSDCANNLGFKYINNWMSASRYATPSPVFGNNVPTYVDSAYQGSQLHGEFTPVMNLLTATGVTLTYGAENKGRYSIINGWMFVDITIHLATVAFTGTLNIYPQVDGIPIVNKATSQAPLLIDYTSNVTWPSTEPFYFQIDSGFKTGLARNRTQSTALGSGGTPSFVTGSTDVKFHCSGHVYVGDQVNIV